MKFSIKTDGILGVFRWNVFYKHVLRKVFPKILTVLCAIFVMILCVDQVRHVEWDKVSHAIQLNTGPVLGAAIALTVLGYLIYMSYDLVSVQYLKQPIASTWVMAIAFIAYAFNLNLGALIGSVAFRFRLYLKLGLPTGTIVRIVGLGWITNWVGYLWVAGALFVTEKLPSVSQWGIGGSMLRLIGVLMLLVALAYVGICGCASRRVWSVQGHQIYLPSLKRAVVQSILGAAHWLFLGVAVWVMMRQEVAYSLILGALLLSSIVGAIAHIPAGLGVVEVVFLKMLGGVLPDYKILGALLTYRAIYYLAPFIMAVFFYFILEARIRKDKKVHFKRAAIGINSAPVKGAPPVP